MYSETYGTFFGHPDLAIKSIVDNLQKLGCDHEVLSGEEANDRYKFFQLPKEYICAVDKSAGILPASKTVHVLQVCNEECDNDSHNAHNYYNKVQY